MATLNFNSCSHYLLKLLYGNHYSVKDFSNYNGFDENCKVILRTSKVRSEQVNFITKLGPLKTKKRNKGFRFTTFMNKISLWKIFVILVKTKNKNKFWEINFS